MNSDPYWQKLGSLVRDSYALRPDEATITIYCYGQPLTWIKWHVEDGKRILTLGELRKQVGGGIITVWEKYPGQGAIFENGTYNSDSVWRLVGKTIGYA